MEAAAKVVKALMECGPSYSEISRRTGVPIPTVRYILRNRLPKLGFTIAVATNHGALGLQRYIVILESRFSPRYMSGLLGMFGELFYLRYYTYLMKERKFLTIFAIPPRYSDDFITFLDSLKSVRIIDDYSVKKLLYMRVLPFRVDSFDFKKGVWKQNWFEKKISIPEVYEEVNPSSRIDKIDLLILKELEKDAFIKYVDLAKKLRLTRQTIKRHFEHVVKAIYMYAVMWVPRWNPDLVSAPILIKAPNAEEARSAIINVPFTYAEIRTIDDEYLGLALAPSIGLYKMIKYISERVKIDCLDFLDMDNSLSFTVPYNLFNEKIGWLNPYELGIEKIMEKIRLFGGRV